VLARLAYQIRYQIQKIYRDRACWLLVLVSPNLAKAESSASNPRIMLQYSHWIRPSARHQLPFALFHSSYFFLLIFSTLSSSTLT
jgi:hypothetical protein